MSDDPADFVLRARRGDKAAFESLIALHGADLLRFLLRLTGRREEAQDVFQDSLLLAFRSIASLRDAEAFRPWLAMIATNVFKKRARRNRGPMPLELTPEITDPATMEHESLSSALESQERARLLRAAIDELPARQRAVISLRLDLGLPFQQIGTTLGISEENARANHYQALKTLRKSLPSFSRSLGSERFLDER